MAKNNVLMFDLNEPITKALADALSNDTGRKILNALSENTCTPKELHEKLNVPLSTITYNLEKLQEATLIEAKDFHYSEKGKKVKHYQLANKHIIISPKKTKGLKSRLSALLPVVVLAMGTAAITFFQRNTASTFTQEAALVTRDAAPLAAKTVSSEPNISLWFFLGGLLMFITYRIIAYRRKQ